MKHGQRQAEQRQAENRGKVDPRTESQRQRSEGTTGKRIPLGSATKKMTVNDHADQLEGYVPRWINDDGDRINRAIAGGYSPVLKSGITVGEGDNSDTDMSSWVSMSAGTKENGAPMKAFLMKIPRHFYEEDQAAKQRQVDKVDEAINGGQQHLQGQGSYVKKVDYKVNSKI